VNFQGALWVCAPTVCIFGFILGLHVGEVAGSTAERDKVANQITSGIEYALHCDPTKNGFEECDVVIGRYAGNTLAGGSRDILMGDCTEPPTPNTSDFVNLGNKQCFWRGEHVDCPPARTECLAKVESESHGR
jgi:hypothetical protein